MRTHPRFNPRYPLGWGCYRLIAYEVARHNFLALTIWSHHCHSDSDSHACFCFGDDDVCHCDGLFFVTFFSLLLTTSNAPSRWLFIRCTLAFRVLTQACWCTNCVWPFSFPIMSGTTPGADFILGQDYMTGCNMDLVHLHYSFLASFVVLVPHLWSIEITMSV